MDVWPELSAIFRVQPWKTRKYLVIPGAWRFGILLGLLDNPTTFLPTPVLEALTLFSGTKHFELKFPLFSTAESYGINQSIWFVTQQIGADTPLKQDATYALLHLLDNASWLRDPFILELLFVDILCFCDLVLLRVAEVELEKFSLRKLDFWR